MENNIQRKLYKTSMQSIDFLIVGAGVCGLGAATRLNQISEKT